MIDRDQVREAVAVLMDGDEVRELSRHTADQFPAAVAALAAAAQAWLDQRDALVTAAMVFDRMRVGGPSMEGRSHFHGSMSSDEFAAFQTLFGCSLR